MKRLSACLLSSVLALALTAVAIGDVRRASDPRGDVSGKVAGQLDPRDVDFIGAKATHGRNGKLHHLVSVAGRVARPGQDDPATILPGLYIHTPRGGPGCEFRMVPIQGERNKAQILACTNGAPRVGGGIITRVDRNTLRFSFKRSQINRPRRYGFLFKFERGGSRDAYDRVPNRRAIRHVLG